MRNFYFILALCFFLITSLKGQEDETIKSMNRIFKHAGYKKAKRHPSSTTHLYLKNYVDSIFPNEKILKFQNLKSLAVQGGHIVSEKIDTVFVPKIRIDSVKLKQLTQLSYLSIDGVTFRGFPEEIFAARQLKGLSLSICNIEVIPRSISRLQELRYLEFRANELSALPEELCELKKLQTLDLCNNKFSAIPPQVLKMKQLNYLYLSNIEISYPIAPTKVFPYRFNINQIDYLVNYHTHPNFF